MARGRGRHHATEERAFSSLTGRPSDSQSARITIIASSRWPTGLLPLDAVGRDVHGLAGAEPDDRASAGEVVSRERCLGKHCRMATERVGHSYADLDRVRRRADSRHHQQRIEMDVRIRLQLREIGHVWHPHGIRIYPIRWQGHHTASKPSRSAVCARVIALSAGGMIRYSRSVTVMRSRLPAAAEARCTLRPIDHQRHPSRLVRGAACKDPMNMVRCASPAEAELSNAPCLRNTEAGARARLHWS